MYFNFRMESLYRTWRHDCTSGICSEDLEELQRELRAALGTAKWQVQTKYLSIYPPKLLFFTLIRIQATESNQVLSIWMKICSSISHFSKLTLYARTLINECRKNNCFFLIKNNNKNKNIIVKDQRVFILPVQFFNVAPSGVNAK